MSKQRHKVTHIPSRSYQNASAFYRWLKAQDYLDRHIGKDGFSPSA